MTLRLLVATLLLTGWGIGLLPTGAMAAQHQVVGKGRFTSGVYRTSFTFDGVGGPSQATGSMRFVVRFDGNVGAVQEGTVTCLKVKGNRLVVAGLLTAGPFAGTYFAVRAADNGRDRRHPHDAVAWNYGLEAPVSCADFDLTGDLDGHRLDSGDIRIA